MTSLLASAPQAFEAAMLICFGVSWPFSIHKIWKTRRTEGKSLVFLVLVLVGYCSGIVAKLLAAAAGGDLQPVTALYALNALMVAIDLALYLRYRNRTGDSDPYFHE